MKPSEAINRYNTHEQLARDEYKNYWIDKFRAAGIVFAPTGLGPASDFNGYALKACIFPARFDGIKINIRSALSPNIWHDVKVKSDRGFMKLVDRLHNKKFVFARPQVPEYSAHWSMDMYKPYKGSITLSNV